MRQFAIVQRILGILLMIFSVSNIPPLFVSLYYQDGSHGAFAASFCITLITGFIIWSPVRRAAHELKLRDGFLVVVAFWIVLGLFGAIPLYLSEQPKLSMTDAVFESISGLTTTGATVIMGLDFLPRGILYYRQQLQWLGGMGIVVLAVAVLPMLGVGGMQLYRAETPGPMKDSKLTPRITETAKALWLIYFGLTVACGLSYWLAGMELFDAIGHAFSTVAIGGFSTHDASMGHYESVAIHLIAIVFMFLAGVNFALHYSAWRAATPRAYFRDPEFRAFFTLVCVIVVISTAFLFFSNTYDDIGTALIRALFQVVSIGTTTGFTTADYAHWPSFLPMMLLLGSFVGGCAGSTAGGIKVIRFLLLAKQGVREINRLIHPSAEIPVKLGNKVVSSHVVQAVWGFFAAYMSIYAFMYLIMLSTGLDEVTAFSAVAACLNNLGPGLGEVASNFATLNAPAKWVLVGAMLLGRLEIFTLLVVFSPMFWRK
ncbi:MAG: TrkH family potassium uptake protein [Salinisphaeraceae bacterium]|nr:TrkH family potassium uptake protein [Salinisphaeraceae bacterium]